MKKTFIKILGTVLAVTVFFIAQYHIRQYYGVDPRIWFFVVFGISLVGFIAILIGFSSEIKKMKEYFNTHSFFDFIENMSEATEKMLSMIRPAAERIVHSMPYMLLSIVALLTSFTGIIYKLFFHDDFMARTTIYIVYLIMIACVFLDRILDLIVVEKSKRGKKLIFAGMWAFIFLTNFLEFVV